MSGRSIDGWTPTDIDDASAGMNRYDQKENG